MRQYETIFIAAADLPTPRLDEIVEKTKSLIAKNSGEIKTTEKWGRRRLSYPIGKNREGFYVMFAYKAQPTIVNDLIQYFRVTDDVIRYMTCIAPVVRPVTPRRGPPGAQSPAPGSASPADASQPKEAGHDKPAASASA